MTVDLLDTPASPPRTRRARRSTLTRASGLGLGIALVWFSLLVMIPLCLVVITAAEGGWSTFWSVLQNPQTAAALRLTVFEALAVTVVNVVMGTLIAWVLVRDEFWGKRALEVVIDIPFALPTIVAGLVLLSLYGPASPLGVDVANTRWSVFLALLFVTLPFVVRTVEPVLMELDLEVEQAAMSLGASRAGDHLRCRPVLRPWHQRVRLARPAVGQPAAADRGRLGPHPDLHRERQRGRRRVRRGHHARGGAHRDRRPRDRLPAGVPP
jgi:sulfate transport system permease protein